jgi:hypothetical protein
MNEITTLPADTNQKPLPEVGRWYWVNGKDQKTGELEEPELLCCDHVGSNFASFKAEYKEHHTKWDEVMLWEPERWQEEPNWRAHFEKLIAALQIEMQEALKLLATAMSQASALPQNAAQASSALVVVNGSPEAQKARLLALQNETVPKAKETVKQLTGKLVGAHKNLILADSILADKLFGCVSLVKDRLFSLELYAGFGEAIEQIASGKPAPISEPIHIHQMIRFMDEETLIDAIDGGMCFDDVKAFDKWAALNIDWITPHPRAIIAWRVRRHSKDYGRVNSISEALRHIAWHQWDKQTYLLIRNGGNVFRIVTDLDFTPRLLPFRSEFEGLQTRSWGGKTKHVGPLDREYDGAVNDRAERLKHHNRIFFIIQGLLDRSEVFHPHDHIDFANEQSVEKFIIPVRDEEDGLPTSQPMSWEQYQSEANKSLRPGDVVFVDFEWTHRPRGWRQRNEEWHLREFMRYEGRADKGKLRVSRSATRTGYQFTESQWYTGTDGERHFGRGEWGEWPTKREHFTCSPDELFRVASYKPGDYKKFLCDAQLKGQYLQWAGYLLSSERYQKTPEKYEPI